MKKTVKAFSLVLFASVILGATFVVTNQNNQVEEAEAATHNQHIDNFELNPYYDGDYYDGIEGTDGLNGTFSKALEHLVLPKDWYEYSSTGSNTLSYILQRADEDPTNTDNMIYLYTRDSVRKNAASSWNREHCWPQSLSNDCWGQGHAGADLLHIRPTYNSTNSTRSNDKYGDVDMPNCNVTYDGLLFGKHYGGVFEPLDSVKGDVARIIMYVYVTYRDFYASQNKTIPEITKTFTSYDTLLKWHTMDKPDVMEGHRNDVAQASKQGNRNPFVDRPDYAWKVFGDKVSADVLEAAKEEYPEGGKTIDPGDIVSVTGVSVDPTSLSVKVGETKKVTATVEPSNATKKTVIWTSSNPDVAVVDFGNVKGIKEGSAVITATTKDGGFQASCTVSVSSTFFGTLENPLTVDQARDLLDLVAKDGGNTPEMMYVTGKVASFTYSEQYNNYQIYLYNNAETSNNAFQFYACVLGTYSASDLLAGKTIIAHGYGKIHNGTTYELYHFKSGPTTYIYPTVDYLGDPIPLNPYITSLELNTSNAKLEFTVGDTFSYDGLVVTGIYNDGSQQIITDFTVSSPDMSTKGSKKVEVTVGNIKASYFIVVKTDDPDPTPTVVATAIALNIDKTTLDEGETIKLHATYSPTNSTVEFSWYSSDESVATIDNSGSLTALSAGKVKITLFDAISLLTDEIELTISRVEPTPTPTLTPSVVATSLTINKDVTTLKAGESLQLKVTYAPNDATVRLYWGSVDESVATVDNNGLVTSLKAGKVTITVYDSVSGKMDEIELTILGEEKACGGSIAATSVVLSATALIGAGLILIKKKQK